MKFYQIKDMTTEDLRNALKDSSDALENFRFQHASGQLENYKSMANAKKDIARIKTVLRQRELAEKNNLKK
ncbi:MAG: 50S ribosomal protein L29 [Ignavibacteria bacterium]|jgi:large subunit ribosomal protein L29|nr:50S ribosomal protein L29 [Ignavibacteria bacterium]